MLTISGYQNVHSYTHKCHLTVTCGDQKEPSVPYSTQFQKNLHTTKGEMNLTKFARRLPCLQLIFFAILQLEGKIQELSTSI